MSAINSFTLNRIKKDIEEISLSPLEGIGISALEDSLMKFVINICLLKGIYKDYCIQLFLAFPEDYPLNPPNILIYPGQFFDNKYHFHISEDISKDENGMNFKKINFNLLDKDFMSFWIPNYSLRTLLEKIQNFLCDPDFPGNESSEKNKKKSEKYLPDKKQLDLLMKQMKSYQRSFLLKGNKIIHTWEKPFPEMYFKKKDNKKNDKIIDIKLSKEEKIKKENLYCFLLRKNYIDDKNISLGFPFIGVIEKKEKEKIIIYPIPELLSDEAFKSIKIDEKKKLQFYYNINIDNKYKSESEYEYFNDWMPIYLDENHYLKNKENILNILNKMKYGPKKKESDELSSNDIFEIFSAILNRIIIGFIVNQSPMIKSIYIKAYFHFFLLFRKFHNEKENDFINYLNKKMNAFYKQERYKDKKKIISKLENFFSLLFFSNIDLKEGKMKEFKIGEIFCEEHLIRQMYWIFHNGHRILNILEKIDIRKLEKEFPYIKEYENLKKEINANKEYTLKIKENENSKFIEELKNNDIYEKVLDIICSDGAISSQGIPNKKSLKKSISKKMSENFQKLFEDCTNGTKSKLYVIFTDYSSLLSIEIQDKYKKEQFKEQEDFYNEELHNLKVNKLIYDDSYKQLLENFLKDSFEYQRANKILLINYIIFKKNKKGELIEQLKENYGVYLETENFMKEIKTKLSEIKTYNQLYKYLESEFCGNENDVEIIRKVYEKAKAQKYVQAIEEEKSFSSHSSQSTFRIDYIGGRSNFEENHFNRVNNRSSYNNVGRGYSRGRGYYSRGYNRGRGRGRGRGYNYNNRY